jgi:DNA-binding beta-propeller fold protein YncE
VTGTPEGIAVDSQGRVYVTDYVLGRIQVFDNDGNPLWALGTDSISKSLFRKPTAIVLDESHGTFLVVNQSGSVQVFQLPQP